MEEAFKAIILGIVQGLTEFLPVSSSGHIVIGSEILGFNAEDNLVLAIVLHVATVMSTIVVLRKDIWGLIKGLLKFEWNEETQYVSKIAISLIPVMIIGLFFKDYVSEFFSSGLLIVGIMLLVTALLLAFSYFAKPKQKEKISFRDALIIGIAQACAILPGLSRSGSTIATGLILGNKKESVARFSFLMVLIPILGETFLEIIKGDMSTVSESTISITALLSGFIAAFVFGVIACTWMINIVKKGKLIYFAYYCSVVGVIAISYALFS